MRMGHKFVLCPKLVCDVGKLTEYIRLCAPQCMQGLRQGEQLNKMRKKHKYANTSNIGLRKGTKQVQDWGL